MFIKIFFKDKGVFSDISFDELAPKLDGNSVYIFVNTEQDFLKALAVLGNNDIDRAVLKSFKSNLIIQKDYLLMSLDFFTFHDDREHKYSIKAFVSEHALIVYNLHGTHQIKSFADTVFRENAFAKESPIYFFNIFLNKILDAYMSLIDVWYDEITNAEILLLEQKGHDTISLELAAIRKKIVYLRSSIYDIVDAVEDIASLDHIIVPEAVQRRFQKSLSKALVIQHALEKINTLIINVYNLYLTGLSARQNDISKTLTIVATIFMPITFITGFFGMNFEMPFLQHPYAYIICTVLMLAVIIFSFYYFKKRKWL